MSNQLIATNTALASGGLTNTCGFFNGNKWPIVLFISEFNVSLTLQPGEFVTDRAGRKINDSYFDAFTAKYRLSRETSEKSVPLVAMPRPQAAQRPVTSSPVTEITKFTHTRGGVRMPVAEGPPLTVAPAMNTNSVLAMSVDEARKRGLIHRTREIREDYGASESEGVPPARIPPIRYATDVVRAPVAPLPEALSEALAEAPADLPASVQALFGNKTTAVAASSAPVNLGRQQKQVVRRSAPRQVAPVPAAPVPAAPVHAAPAPVAEFPEPDADEVVPEPEAEDDLQPFICAADGRAFDTRAELLAHATKNYKKLVPQLMAHYPE